MEIENIEVDMEIVDIAYVIVGKKDSYTNKRIKSVTIKSFITNSDYKAGLIVELLDGETIDILPEEVELYIKSVLNQY